MTQTRTDLRRNWHDALAQWRIPPEILAAAPASPWIHPAGLLTARAQQQLAEPSGPSMEVAAQALPLLRPGTVLDVGAGPGAASLALAGRIGHITAVDEDEAMLGTFAKLAAGAGVPAKTLHGRWPDIAGSAPVADVVLCHNVLYNVPDLEPFLTELTAHSRGRVVVELSAQHPMTVLNPLWKAVHGIDRPERPTAMDAIELATALGLDPRWYAWERPNTIDDGHGFDDLVAMVTRRLCLPPERAGEVERALRKAGVTRAQPRLGPPSRETITVWWPGFAH